MNSVEAKYRISTGEFDTCSVMPWNDGCYVLNFEKLEVSTYFYRARGELARFKTIDAAVTTAKAVGWDLWVKVYP